VVPTSKIKDGKEKREESERRGGLSLPKEVVELVLRNTFPSGVVGSS